MNWKVLTLIMCLFLVACSGTQTTEESEEGVEGVELAEEVSDDYIDDDELMMEEDLEEALPQDQSLSMIETPDDQGPGGESSMRFTDGKGVYTVGKNETLMMVAFKLYGDYTKWRDIAKHNKDKIINGQYITPGMKLEYPSPDREFVWTPKGEPYLIQWGDTLGRISNKVYGTQKRWKYIWDNNRPMIKDPNKIYAGFTLYYLLNGKDVALQ